MEIKQERQCQRCNKVTVYDGWVVDGYGFTTVQCEHCGAFHNCFGATKSQK